MKAATLQPGGETVTLQPYDEVLDPYDEVLALVDRLVEEFAGVIPAGSVVQRVSRVRWYLIAMGVRDNLLSATEHAVRAQLTQQVTRRSA